MQSGPFWLRLRARGIDQMPATGRLGADNLTRLAERSLANAQLASAPVYGKPALPIIRVSFADDARFSSLSSNSFMGGEAQGNEIVIRLGMDEVMQRVMTHEWVHILQQIEYDSGRFPRWLLEGYAESATSSARSTAWSARAIETRGLSRAFDRGVFSTIISWGRGAASGPQESDNYQLSHLAVDFLRFGNFPAAETRLAALHAAIDGRVPDRQAIQEIYGMSLQELDRALVEWLNPAD